MLIISSRAVFLDIFRTPFEDGPETNLFKCFENRCLKKGKASRYDFRLKLKSHNLYA